MNLMKKGFLTMLTVFAASLILSGCDSEQKHVIELFSTKPENIETLKKLSRKFEEEKKNKVVIEISSPSDANLVLRSRRTKNDIPDVIALGGDINYIEFGGDGFLKNLSQEAMISEVHPAYLKMLYDINGDKSKNAYAVPYASNGSGIIYNRKLFEKAGISIPKTWSEFVQAVNTLKAKGILPFELTFLDSWTTLPVWNSIVSSVIYPGFIQEKKSHEITFEETHKEVLEKYLFILENSQGRDFLNTSYEEGNRHFANGESAMMINGCWAISEIKKYNPDCDIDVFPFPASDDEEKNIVTTGIDVALAIGKDSKHKKIAKQFIEFLLRPENAQIYIDEQFAFSAVKGVEQNDRTVTGLKSAIAAGKVSDYPDHYYPSGFDLSAILVQFASNYTKSVPDKQNISVTLKACDKQFDALNFE